MAYLDCFQLLVAVVNRIKKGQDARYLGICFQEVLELPVALGKSAKRCFPVCAAVKDPLKKADDIAHKRKVPAGKVPVKKVAARRKPVFLKALFVEADIQAFLVA